METGRRDGITSLASDARDNLPPPNVEVSKAILLFEAVGLTKEDFILLMGNQSKILKSYKIKLLNNTFLLLYTPYHLII